MLKVNTRISNNPISFKVNKGASVKVISDKPGQCLRGPRDTAKSFTSLVAHGAGAYLQFL